MNPYALLAKDLHKTVGTVMRRGNASSDVLIDYMVRREKYWNYRDWLAKLAEMDHSKQTVESFLEDHTP